ncbi:MAG: helix-turn-helix transcriptional regulator [Opitutae bacterium]|nr:helix-turn-helix transcriptional regulator [Opitutae bacterium]
MQGKNYDKVELFGERLRFARSGAGLTQVQLAEKMGKGAATISDWEKSKAEPSLEEIVRLGTLLGVDPRRLAFGFSVRSEVVEEPAADHMAPLNAAAELRDKSRQVLEAMLELAGENIGRLGWIHDEILEQYREVKRRAAEPAPEEKRRHA